MLLSKKNLSARMKRKTLGLSEKINLIDFAKKNPTFGCRKIGEIDGTWKTSVACILKDQDNIRKEFKMFEGTCCYDLI